MPRAPKKTQRSRHQPLSVQLHQDDLESTLGRLSASKSKRKPSPEPAELDEDVMDPLSSQKILALAKEQQFELESLSALSPAETRLAGPELRNNGYDTADTTDEEDLTDDSGGALDMNEFADGFDPSDFDIPAPPEGAGRKTLADLIFSKLESTAPGDVRSAGKLPDSAHDPAEGLDPRVVETYTKIGLYLHKYKSGALPKLFKILPTHAEWARLLALTSPERWSPNATSRATRLFVPALKPEQARVYLEGVLLSALREDIRENSKLNVHYYEALKRSVFKPAAFFKGIVFPLCDSGCTLKEAIIVSSVISKLKIPMLHCAAALHRISSMDYSGPNSLFIRVLLDKKYALPYKVLDSIFEHFVRLSNTYRGNQSRGESPNLPVLWHQSFLVFCQRYASDLTQDQKNALLDVVRASNHPQISPEIRRELVQSVARGEPRPSDMEL